MACCLHRVLPQRAPLGHRCALRPFSLLPDLPPSREEVELLRSLIFLWSVHAGGWDHPRVCPVTSSPPLLFSRVCINFSWYLSFPRSLKIDLDCTSRRMGYTKIWWLCMGDARDTHIRRSALRFTVFSTFYALACAHCDSFSFHR